ncbi:hypothetical protein BKI52_36770 [marine bacterium AO1-C]|nr:hypothetical protein BKI52_36770 [marine bacterium AO1-C]
MANQHVAWSINSRNEVSLIYENHQGPPMLGDTQVTDISYSVSETVFILSVNDGHNYLEYGKSQMPTDWKSVTVVLPSDVRVNKIDASPADKVYLVLSNGMLAEIATPDGAQATPQMIDGSEGAIQVSAAPDGNVWIVATTSEGSIVRCLNGNEWKTVPDINNALRVTGTANGEAYVIKSDGNIVLVNTEGVQKEVPFEHNATEISVGADGTLWVIAQDGDVNGGLVYTTSDTGANWHHVPSADAKYLDAGTLAVAEATN